MRRYDRQITDKSEIDRILSTAELCHLAMIDGGKPYVVPLNFGYAEGSLYFHSAPEGRKIEILRKNPKVCFSIVARHELVESENACSWTARYESITGEGRAHIVTERNEVEKGLSILMGQYSNEMYDFTENDLSGVIVIRVEIEEMEGKSSF